MGSGIEKEYGPDPERAAAYDALYERYCRLASYEEDQRGGAGQEESVRRFDALKEAAWKCNMELPALGLVVHTFGNASVFDRREGFVAIKPSGVQVRGVVSG